MEITWIMLAILVALGVYDSMGACVFRQGRERAVAAILRLSYTHGRRRHRPQHRNPHF